MSQTYKYNEKTSSAQLPTFAYKNLGKLNVPLVIVILLNLQWEIENFCYKLSYLYTDFVGLVKEAALRNMSGEIVESLEVFFCLFGNSNLANLAYFAAT